MHNIMICSAGRRVSLVSYFQKEVKELMGPHASVFASDLEPELSPACRTADGVLKIGKFADPSYIPELLEFCLANAIGLIVPTIDTELKLLAQHRASFEDAGIHIVVSELDFVSICRNKYKTNDFFQQVGFRVPSTVDLETASYPFFIKPVDGSSSKDIYIICDESRLAPFMKNQDKFMHLEFLSPEKFDEYTVDLYFDKFSKLRCAVPRLRIATRGGEIAKGRTAKNAVLDHVLARFPSIEGARGCITLQLFLDKSSHEAFGIEINPRFGGGYPLSYLAGANYPRMLIQEYLLGQTIEYFDGWQDELLLLRYDAEMVVNEREA